MPTHADAPSGSSSRAIKPGEAGKTYRCAISVRGYELDSFGHVNHAVYIQYLEHARWELLIEEGITLQTFQKWKCWPVISRVEASYLRPCFLDDKLEVRTRITDQKLTRFAFEQEIYRGEVKVFEGKVHSVMVNEQGRPAPIPKELADTWGIPGNSRVASDSKRERE